jgi:hypothetical protein
MQTSNRSKLIAQLVAEHNAIRTNPKSYIPILEKYISYFKGDTIYKPGHTTGIMTDEGKSAYQEAIKFLKTVKPLGELELSDDLSKASQDHADDIGPKGECDHTGSDGSGPSDRIERYLQWDITCSENIDFGGSCAEEVIVSLVVDDGVSDRGHRTNIFNSEINYIGVGIADHTQFETVTVLNYVGGIIKTKGGNSSNTNNKRSSKVDNGNIFY